MAYEKQVDKRTRRPSPTWYFVLGALWTVLALGGAGISGNGMVTAALALMAVANLAVGAAILRKNRANAPADVTEP